MQYIHNLIQNNKSHTITSALYRGTSLDKLYFRGKELSLKEITFPEENIKLLQCWNGAEYLTESSIQHLFDIQKNSDNTFTVNIEQTLTTNYLDFPCKCLTSFSIKNSKQGTVARPGLPVKNETLSPIVDTKTNLYCVYYPPVELFVIIFSMDEPAYTVVPLSMLDTARENVSLSESLEKSKWALGIKVYTSESYSMMYVYTINNPSQGFDLTRSIEGEVFLSEYTQSKELFTLQDCKYKYTLFDDTEKYYSGNTLMEFLDVEMGINQASIIRKAKYVGINNWWIPSISELNLLYLYLENFQNYLSSDSRVFSHINEAVSSTILVDTSGAFFTEGIGDTQWELSYSPQGISDVYVIPTTILYDNAQNNGVHVLDSSTGKWVWSATY